MSGFWLGVAFSLGRRAGRAAGRNAGVGSASLGLGDDAGATKPPVAGPPPASAPAPQVTPDAGAAAPAATRPRRTPGAPPMRPRRRSPRRTAAEPAEDKVAAGSPDKAARRRRCRRGGAAARRRPERRERRHRRGRAPRAPPAQTGGRRRRAPAAKPKPRAGRKPRKAETALLHITSAPKGAIVRTKARVLGRTPINLHFKTGNTYELNLSSRATCRRPAGWRSTTPRQEGGGDAQEAPAAEEAVVLQAAPMTSGSRCRRLLAAILADRRRVAQARRRSRPCAARGGRVAARGAAAAIAARRAGVRHGVRSRDHAAVDRTADPGRRRAGRQHHRSRPRSGVRAPNLETARAYADRVAAGEDPYRTATGMIVKAYRADWDGTLQPYALYVPRDYKPGPARAVAADRRAARRVSPITGTTCAACSASTTARARTTRRRPATSCRCPRCRRWSCPRTRAAS